MTNKTLIIGLALVGAVVGGSGCGHVQPFNPTIPTCTNCTLTYGAPTTAIGTVTSMQRNYQWAEVRTDVGNYRVNPPSNGVQFSSVLVPAPARKPNSALLYLCLQFLTGPPACDLANGTFLVQ